MTELFCSYSHHFHLKLHVFGKFMSRYFKLFPTVMIIPFYLCTIQQRITNTLQKKQKQFFNLFLLY